MSTKKSDPSAEHNDVLVVGGDEVKCIPAAKDPSQLPWKELGAEYVIESTGLFNDGEKAGGHLAAGAKKVILSALSASAASDRYRFARGSMFGCGGSLWKSGS